MTVDVNTEAPEVVVAAPETQANPKVEGTTILTEGEPKVDAQPEVEAEKKTEDKPAGAPENYADFTLPEGVEFNADLLGEYKSLAKELGLTQEAAQKLVDLAAKNPNAMLEQQAAQWAEIREGWVKEITDDKEFGGAKLTETVEGAKRALAKFGTPALKEFIESTGYGDNPELIRLLAKVDKATREDRIVDGAPPIVAEKKDPAKILYPNQS